MNKALIAAAVAAALAPAAALAEVSYSYGEISYIDPDIDGVTSTDSGFGLEGSFAVNDNWHVMGEYDMNGFDVGPIGLDASFYRIAVGYNTELSNGASMFARLGFEAGDLDVIDDSGFGVEFGARGMITDAIELEGSLHYRDLGDLDDDTIFAVSGRYYFNQFSVGLGYETGDDLDILRIGGRFDFGGN